MEPGHSKVKGDKNHKTIEEDADEHALTTTSSHLFLDAIWAGLANTTR